MLLDTSGLMCLFDQKDNRHTLATRQYESATRRLIHNYVFAEFVALAIARRAPGADALRFIDSIHHSNEIEVVWVDSGLHEQAMRLLAERVDKRWTLCDAVSFILMSAHGIGEALTTDHDFEQAGFVRLLVS
jgi:predicted nucleic acid-binding protein